MGSLLALGGALSWGAGDFLAGLATKRIAVFTVLAFSQAIGLVGIGLWVALARDPFPGTGELLHAVAAHHDRAAARTAEAAVLYHANQLDAQAATRPVGD